jgi:nucleoside-diphosphate-sugar epimerase
MSQRFVDDKTGLIITADRSYQVGMAYGDDEPREPRDFESLEDLINCIRKALANPKSKPPLQIIVRTWQHSPTIQASWE